MHTSDYLHYLRRKQTVTSLLTTPKYVTALPCKMKKIHLTEGNVAFLQMLVTLKKAGCRLALVAQKMTDQINKKLTMKYSYTDNWKQ